MRRFKESLDRESAFRRNVHDYRGCCGFEFIFRLLVSVDQAKQIYATAAESLTFNIVGLVNHGGVGNMVQCRVGSSSVDDEVVSSS